MKMTQQDNSPSPNFFLNSSVRRGKDRALKIRLQTLIRNKGMSESEFYNSLGMSKQVWYALSWGIWEATLDWKLKIAKALETDSALIWQRKRK